MAASFVAARSYTTRARKQLMLARNAIRDAASVEVDAPVVVVVEESEVLPVVLVLEDEQVDVLTLPGSVVEPVPQAVCSQPCDSQVLEAQAKLAYRQASQLIGNPLANDKLLTVGTAAV